MDDTITVRLFTASQLTPTLLEQFCHEQRIRSKWVKSGEGYTLVKADELRQWDREKRRWIPEYLRRQLDSRGFVAGAFSNGRLVGFASLDGDLQGETEKYANLTMLFVDDRWKRRGIGSRLFRQMCLCGQKLQADKIFISAVPSEDTVAFYFRMGCIDAAYVPESFADTEQDRYLEYNLSLSQDAEENRKP